MGGVCTLDTAERRRWARAALKRLWQLGNCYTKASVILDGLEPERQVQLTLFEAAPISEKRAKLMIELDAPNRRFGKGTVKLASLVLSPDQLQVPWEGQARWRTLQYTTRLEDLLLVG